MKWYLLFIVICVFVGLLIGSTMMLIGNLTGNIDNTVEETFRELEALKPGNLISNVNDFNCVSNFYYYVSYVSNCIIANYSPNVASISVTYNEYMITNLSLNLRDVELAHIIRLYGRPDYISRPRHIESKNYDFQVLMTWDNFAFAYARFNGTFTIRARVTTLLLYTPTVSNYMEDL